MVRIEYGFKTLSLLAIAALTVGACSPLAPSVSKLSNASSQKSDSADAGTSSAQTGSAGTGSAAPFAGAKSTSHSDSAQQTLVTTDGAFQKDWELVTETRPAFKLSVKEISTFAVKGNVSLQSSDPRVKGREEQLAAGKIRIILGVALDLSGVSEYNVDQVQLAVKWNPETSKWDLGFAPQFSVDPAKDLNDIEHFKEVFQNHLSAVGIEFLSE